MSCLKMYYFRDDLLKWVLLLTIVTILLWPFMVFSLYIHAFSKQQTKETTSWQTFAKRPASFVCLETFFLFQRRAFWRLNQDLRFPVDTQWKRKSSKNRLLSQKGLQINKRCLFLLEHIILGLELHTYVLFFYVEDFFLYSNEESSKGSTNFKGFQ